MRAGKRPHWKPRGHAMGWRWGVGGGGALTPSRLGQEGNATPVLPWNQEDLEPCVQTTKNFYPICSACVLHAWAAGGPGVTHPTPRPRRCWVSSQKVLARPLPATVTRWLSSLIHSASAPWSRRCIASWFSERRGKDRSFSLGQRAAPTTYFLLSPKLRVWCRTGGTRWVRRRRRVPKWLKKRRRCDGGRIRAAPSQRRRRYRRHRRRRPGRRTTPDQNSSSIPSWLTAAPQAGFTDSPTSRNCTPRSPRCLASLPQRYKTHQVCRQECYSLDRKDCPLFDKFEALVLPAGVKFPFLLVFPWCCERWAALTGKTLNWSSCLISLHKGNKTTDYVAAFRITQLKITFQASSF